MIPQSLGEALEAVAFSPDGTLLAVRIILIISIVIAIVIVIVIVILSNDKVGGHDRVLHVFKFETKGK